MIIFQGKSDLFILIGVSLIWAFISINLNTILGLVYIVMCYFYWNMIQSGRVYPIIMGKPELAKLVGIGLIVAFAWIYLLSGKLGSIAPAVGMEGFKRMFAIKEEPIPPYLVLFIMGVLVPITEELFFRGSVIPFLAGKVTNKILLCIVSASIFALWHLTAYNAANEAMVSAFVFGLLTAFVTIKTGQLVHSMFIHGILNTIVIASSLGFLAIGI